MTRALPENTERRLLYLALLLLAGLTGVALLSRPLIPIDETRYISVAWEMWLRGDFLVPFKNGQPYSDKPPLLMWLFQLGWSVTGVNAWWPRLVSPLSAAACLFLSAALAHRLWPQRPALAGVTPLILGTCLLWMIFATSGMFDVLLTVFVLLGVLGIRTAADGEAGKGFTLLGIAIGMGILAKGPVVLLHTLPVALLAPWWCPGLARRRWYLGLGLAILAGAAIGLAWAIPAGIAGGEKYRDAIFWGQTAERMVDSFAHKRPVWWYVLLLPAILFPWFLWPATWRGFLAAFRRRQGDLALRFCLAWLLPVFVAFSLISGKQVHYLIPAFPAFALLIARGLDALDRPPGVSWLPLSAVLFGGALLALDWIAPGKSGLALPPRAWPAIALLLLGPLLWYGARRWSAPLAAIALFGAGLAALVQLSLAPSLFATYDTHRIASAVAHIQQNGGTVANDGTYHDQYHFAGRLRQPLVELRDRQALVTWLRGHQHGYVVLYSRKYPLPADLTVIARQRYLRNEALLLTAPEAIRALAAAGALTDPASPTGQAHCDSTEDCNS